MNIQQTYHPNNNLSEIIEPTTLTCGACKKKCCEKYKKKGKHCKKCPRR